MLIQQQGEPEVNMKELQTAYSRIMTPDAAAAPAAAEEEPKPQEEAAAPAAQ